MKSKTNQVRKGLWIDDDVDFMRPIKREFQRFENYRLKVLNNPYAVDWYIREEKPEFVVFDIRWKETEGGHWYGDETVGLNIMSQVQSAFPDLGLMLGFVVSDLAPVGRYRDQVSRFKFIKNYYDKSDFVDISVLCNDIRDLVEENIGELKEARKKYLDWSRVCSSLSNPPLSFVDEQIKAVGQLEGLSSPAAWKLGLDKKMYAIVTTCNRLLMDWYADSSSARKAVVERVSRLFDYGHGKTREHGYFLYLLRYGLNLQFTRAHDITEPQGMAVRKIVEYLMSDNRLSDIETMEIGRQLMKFQVPERVYLAKIIDLSDDHVHVLVTIGGKQTVEGAIHLSEFPSRELDIGMDIQLEVRTVGEDVILTPHVLTPSIITSDEDILPKRRMKRKGKQKPDD